MDLQPKQFSGTGWMQYDELPDTAKNAVRHWSTVASPEQLEARARTRQWQMEHVPVDEMKKRVMADDPDLGHQHGDFEGYHRWYLSAGPVPEHGASRWPVIEKDPRDETEGYLDDGWHRFHSYVRAGDTHIPLLRQRER